MRQPTQRGEIDARTRGTPHARRSSGFTIIEIMLGLAILAVLMGIAVSNYGSYRERTLITQAVRDIVDLDARIQMYRLDNSGYPAGLDDIGMAGKADPWGNPYQYTNLETAKGKGSARKNKNLVPINSDFDLYSMGKDGNSVGPLTAKASRDDIVRANDGRFIGLASEYDP